jgi:hypothetical protein
MQFNIPSIGDRFELTQDWECTLFFEYRNNKFIKKIRPELGNIGWAKEDGSVLHIFPKGTILRVDRIYIRKGNSDYDSVTFLLPKQETVPYNGRFWAKLVDVNEIHFGELG